MQEQSDKDVSSSNSAIDLKKILQDLHQFYKETTTL